jgi:FAD/FMN-containing dehydrogenase
MMLSLEVFKEKAKEIVGPEWVFDDPVDRYPYARDMVTDGLKRYTEMLPDLVVMPISAEEIQKIIILANEQDVPLFVIGSGSSLLIGSVPTRQGGVTIDCKRMQKVEIDYENLTVSVEAGVCALQLSGEIKKIAREKDFPYRPYFGGGPGSSHHNGTNILTGQNKLAGYKYAMGVNCVSAVEMILPDGTMFKTSSMACGGPGIWAHGPGPDFAHLPFFANAAFGIVTRIVWQLFPVPETYKTTWAYFKDFKLALKAVKQIMRREIGKGLTVMDCWTHSAYSSETIAESRILSKCAPKIFLGFSSEGSERKVAYETKIVTQILKEAGGRIAPPELVEVWRGHEMNSKGWQQSNSPRILKHLGRVFAAGTYLAVNEYDDFFDRMDKIMEEMAGKLDGFANHPEPGFGEFAHGPQTYLSQFGHSNGAVEFIYAWDHRHEQNTKAMVTIGMEIKKVPVEMGAGPFALGRDPDLPKTLPNNYKLARKMKSVFDPKNVLAPGIGFVD